MSAIKILLIRETVAQSWLRDLGTFTMFAGLIGLGWLIDSTTMQVVGAIVGMTATFARAGASRNIMTIQEARAALDRWEAGNE